MKLLMPDNFGNVTAGQLQRKTPGGCRKSKNKLEVQNNKEQDPNGPCACQSPTVIVGPICTTTHNDKLAYNCVIATITFGVAFAMLLLLTPSQQ